MIDRRAAMYGVKAAASSTKMTATWSPSPYNRLMAAKFYAGDTWITKAREHGATQQMMEALKTIAQGWAIAFSPIPKAKIVHHFG